MRIAFISYEYPPDTAIGGIATYVRQAAALLSRRGHEVEVFAGSPTRRGCVTDGNVTVHLVHVGAERRGEFAKGIAPIFAARHRELPFDVVEGPELDAEAAPACRLVPDIPLVVKLHMGRYLIRQVEKMTLGALRRIRVSLGAFRRGQVPYWHRRFPCNRREWDHTRSAHEVVAPSHSVADWMVRDWGLDRTRLSVVPNPYVGDKALLRIPAGGSNRVASFVGRLEVRKGVLDLAAALPDFLSTCPGWDFRFVGHPLNSPEPGLDMAQYIAKQLPSYRDRIQFLGAVPSDEMHNVYMATDFCVYPSIWENFPNVCLEAMAAGRAIIGSCAGGMAEQLDSGKCGVLVPPRDRVALAEAMIKLATATDTRRSLGTAARQRVTTIYGEDAIGPMLEATYRRAMVRRRAIRGCASTCKAVTEFQ